MSPMEGWLLARAQMMERPRSVGGRPQDVTFVFQSN
jgi:hypothetical protein